MYRDVNMWKLGSCIAYFNVGARQIQDKFHYNIVTLRRSLEVDNEKCGTEEFQLLHVVDVAPPFLVSHTFQSKICNKIEFLSGQKYAMPLYGIMHRQFSTKLIMQEEQRYRINGGSHYEFYWGICKLLVKAKRPQRECTLVS